MRDENCVFNKGKNCSATTREFCTNCKFRTTEAEYRQSRQKSFDRRKKLGAAESEFDIQDLKMGVITGGGI